ncbi:MAG: hypothetical protein CL666_07405 [Balneola sp.]|nr:hypothetical protein [Balneola sp.]|tara:strand:- start:40405 stop:40797 length:393 start_codon:yes stop_codon:yes gene_type:complete
MKHPIDDIKNDSCPYTPPLKKEVFDFNCILEDVEKNKGAEIAHYEVIIGIYSGLTEIPFLKLKHERVFQSLLTRSIYFYILGVLSQIYFFCIEQNERWLFKLQKSRSRGIFYRLYIKSEYSGSSLPSHNY